jgi:hypothetical protein
MSVVTARLVHDQQRSTAMDSTMIEAQARHQIAERVARASSPTVPAARRRHRLAKGLRRFADRIDS